MVTRSEKSDKLIAAAVNRYRKLRINLCFDPAQLESRPTVAQQEVLDDLGNVTYRYVLGGNQSGKTQLGAREVSWIFQEVHPNWTRPERWGMEPLQILVVGRTTKQIEETIWKKIEAFLEPGTYDVQRIGGVVQKVTHHVTGNTILFFSHHADSEAREKVQSFVAHYVWLDEMPKSYKLIEELHRRIQARKGYFLATFTPKSVNRDIQKLVDSSDGVLARKYKLKMFDSPIYDEEDKKRILASLISATDSYRRTVLEGDWAAGDNMVYQFDLDGHIRVPEGYSTSWRHVESVDPALRSQFGFTLWAEEPRTGFWYCVEASYISGIYDPVALYQEVMRRTDGYNVIRRICDPHESWYLGTASTARTKPEYMTPYDKNRRKGELIKGLQEALGKRVFIAPHCTDLIDEFTTCAWSDTVDGKIVNASSYHLLDSAQYFVDLMPKPEKHVGTDVHWQELLYQGHRARIEAEERRKQAAQQRSKLHSRVGRTRWKR